MVFHGYAITHVDTPAHFFWEGRIYNGRSCNLVTAREGATVEAVELLHDGVVSRGVLLDVARTRGIRWMERGEGVMPEDLEAAELASGVRVEPGDVLLVRTGNYARRLAEGPVNPNEAGSPGPHAALLPWLRERGVALWGSDTHNDVTPTPYPAMGHPFHIGALGPGALAIDNMNLEDIGGVRRWSRWSSSSRWRCPAGQRHRLPVNPIASRVGRFTKERGVCPEAAGLWESLRFPTQVATWTGAER
jgi:kynurenine formamidase